MKYSRVESHTSILALAAALLAPAAAQAQTQGHAPAATQPAPAQPAQPSQSAPDVVVTGTRSDVIASPDRVSFNVGNDLQVQTGSVADALRAVPGVEVDLEGRVSLRGDPGVTILIDGRPSAMLRGDNRGDVLLSMPAGQIERVEVITNPSAAMSPEGSGGVINLVSKRVRKDTTTGTVRANIGREGRGAINLSGTHSASGLTLTGDVGYRRFTGEGTGTQLRERLDPATGAFVPSRIDTEIDSTSEARTARLGVEYDVGKTDRLSTELSFREGRNEVDRDDIFTGQNLSYERDSEIHLLNRGVSARGSWRHSFPGKEHELLAEAELERGRLRREVEAVTDFSAGPNSSERILNAGRRGDETFKLDYKRPLGEETSLNVGYQGNLSTIDFTYEGARGASFDALLPVPNLTNEFGYDQEVHAVFGTVRFPTGKLDVQAGLRLEQVDTTLNQRTDGVTFERDYFRVYPTLHLGYDLSKTDQLRGSYSRRIQRPSPQDLNPYTIYLDPQNLRRGNPNLLPEITDSLEIAWHHRKAGNFYSLTGFYRRSEGGVTDLVSDIGGGVFLTTRANIATADRAGAEFVANGRFSKTLTYNASATLLWHRIDIRPGGVSSPRDGLTGTARANLSWQPTPKDFFQLNAVYSGRQLLPQGYRLGGGVLNLGYRRKVNDRLSLLVTGQDVLSSARQVVVIDTPTIRDRFTQRGNGRTVLFGLSYNLGAQNSRKRPQEPGFEFGHGGGDTPQ